MNSKGKPVAVVIGATSKWQSDGRNTRLVHGGDIDDSDLPVGVRWGVGGAISLKFAQEGFFTVLTTRCCLDLSALSGPLSPSWLPRTSWPYDVILRFTALKTIRRPSDLLANQGSLGLSVPFWLLAQSIRFGERIWMVMGLLTGSQAVAY